MLLTAPPFRVPLSGDPLDAIGGTFNPPARTAAPTPHMARVRCLATGAVVERHHVDCRELIASGNYVSTP